MSQLLFILSHAGCSNVASVLDNTFHFYSQFLPAVNTAIQQLTGPLEKEFKVVILKANKHMNFLNYFLGFSPSYWLSNLPLSVLNCCKNCMLQGLFSFRNICLFCGGMMVTTGPSRLPLKRATELWSSL